MKNFLAAAIAAVVSGVLVQLVLMGEPDFYGYKVHYIADPTAGTSAQESGRKYLTRYTVPGIDPDAGLMNTKMTIVR